jgi:hypothetical protein
LGLGEPIAAPIGTRWTALGLGRRCRNCRKR